MSSTPCSSRAPRPPRTRPGALDKLGKLVDPKASTNASAVAAVRGAAIEPAKDSVTWMSDSVDVSAVMDEGRKLVRDGDFSAAAAKFDEAVVAAEGDEKDSATYAEAWSLAADDSNAKAVKLLRGMPSSGTWAGPRALLLARLDIDSGAKAEARPSWKRRRPPSSLPATTWISPIPCSPRLPSRIMKNSSFSRCEMPYGWYIMSYGNQGKTNRAYREGYFLDCLSFERGESETHYQADTGGSPL